VKFPLSKYIWFDGKLVPVNMAKVPVTTHAIHYGTSIFEGIRAYWNSKNLHVFRLKDHVKRFRNSGKFYNIKLIKDQASVPVLVDAGIGCASDAAKAMELGCDGVLMNSAIANANNPLLMASAMKHAVIAGRESYLAGRMMKKAYASASSPMENLI